MMNRLTLALAALLLVAAGPPGVTTPAPTIGTTPGTVAAGNDNRITGAVQTIASVALLRAMPYAPAIVPATVNVTGYSSATDFGGGIFQWSASSTAADDGGMVFNPTGNSGPGRWLRILPGRTVSPDMWGAKGNYIADDTAAVQAAFAYGIANQMLVDLPSPRYLVTTVNVSGALTVRGHGFDNTAIYRITSADASGSAATGGTLPAGTYSYLVYAYNGASLIKVQPGAGTITLDGSTTTALSVNYAAVPGANDYQIYYTSGTSPFGSATYMLDAGSALSVTITATGATVPGGAPQYIDPVINVASGSFVFGLDDIQVNGNGRAAQAIYFADYPNGDFPYYYSLNSRKLKVYGGLINQIYLGTRRFNSQCVSCDIAGGWQSVVMKSSADHRWVDVDISKGADAELVQSNQNNNTFVGVNLYFGSGYGARLVASSNTQFFGGNIGTNASGGFAIDATSAGTNFNGTVFNANNTSPDITNNGLKTALVGAIFKSGGVAGQVPAYNLVNGATADTVYAPGVQFYAGVQALPYSTAFTSDASKLSVGSVTPRKSDQPLGYFNQSFTTGITAAGTSQASAVPLASAFNRVTAASSGFGSALRLDSATPTATEVVVINETGVVLGVYPPTAGQIGSLTSNAPYYQPAHSVSRYFALSSGYFTVFTETPLAYLNQTQGVDAVNLCGTGSTIYAQFGYSCGPANTVGGYGAGTLGANNIANGAFSLSTGNYTSDFGRFGWSGYASGRILAGVYSQDGKQILRGSTNSGAVRLTADQGSAGSANVVNLPATTTASYTLRITLNAFDVTNPANTYSWTMPISTLYKTGTAQSTTTLALGTAVTLATNSWAASVSAAADNTNGGLNLTFAPPSGNADSIRVVARVESLEEQ